jgi:hypothetical protein
VRTNIEAGISITDDPSNARYWYRRTDRMEHVEDEPRAELAAIKVELL